MKTNILYGKIADLFPSKGTILVADDYFRGKGVLEAWGRPIVWIHAAESEKTLATVERITAQLLELLAGRDAFLLGVGGGITSDVTGFVASIYKRGVRFGLVPTTLLAQVDAAIGGKNGVNFDRYKNMVGTFRQADFVYVDTDFLRTLPERELRCGAAEMLKTFILADAKAYLSGGKRPADGQIWREIDYAMAFYGWPQPAMLICYEREAYAWADDPAFRVTFDSAPRARETVLQLECGSAGAALLPMGMELMEVKSSGAMPLAFARTLNELGILPTSFSKYGTAYQNTQIESRDLQASPMKGAMQYVSNL